MSRQDGINRRLLRLGIGELVAAVVFALVAVRGTAGSPAAIMPVWSALIPLLAVLVQAGVYWLVRSRRTRLPPAVAATYRAFRILDPGLLVLGLVGVVLWWPASLLAGGVAVAVWLFGLVEYVNYFVVRLAYPPARWLSEVGRCRWPQLLKDLNR